VGQQAKNRKEVSFKWQIVDTVTVKGVLYLSYLDEFDESTRNIILQAMAKNGVIDSVKISGNWHYQFNLPVKKIWNPMTDLVFNIMPTPEMELSKYDAIVYDKNGKYVFPDSIQIMTVNYSKKTKEFKWVKKKNQNDDTNALLSKGAKLTKEQYDAKSKEAKEAKEAKKTKEALLWKAK